MTRSESLPSSLNIGFLLLLVGIATAGGGGGEGGHGFTSTDFILLLHGNDGA